MARSGTTYIDAAVLRLSKAPAAEIAAASMQARETAGLEEADLVIVAVPVGHANRIVADVNAAAARASDALELEVG